MINRALRLVRQFHDISQFDLAKEFNLSKNDIIDLESGKKPANAQIIEQYASHFNIPTSTLIFFSESLDSNDTKKSSKFRKAFGDKTLSMFEWIVSNEKKKKIQA